MQKGIPYMHFRGGSSKALFFNAADLPSDVEQRNRWILAAVEGSDLGDPRQIDGLGGGSALSSKVAIVSMAENTEGVSKIPVLDYYFVQVMIGKGAVSINQTCGNVLAGVLPFAIESGMVAPTHPTTKALVNIVNTGGTCEVIVETPNGVVNYAGQAKVDGVVGTAAPIVCNYLDTEGATCGALLPTGNAVDVIEGYSVTCIDNGMPVVVVRAADFDRTGYESKNALDADVELKTILEKIRLKAGEKMGLGDVTNQSIPKMCLVAPPQYGGVVTTRMFIPHVCHDAIGVLAAVSVATACVLPDSVAQDVAVVATPSAPMSIEHPSGEMTVNLAYDFAEKRLQVHQSGVIRTARLLSRGTVFIPEQYTH